jgi:DNA-binding HxlR family transcriptional regulator
MIDEPARRQSPGYELFASRGKLTIVAHLLGAENMRLSELERAILSMPQRRLVRNLRELENDGVVMRAVVSATPPRVEYSLTDWGRAVAPVLETLREWFDARPR